MKVLGNLNTSKIYSEQIFSGSTDVSELIGSYVQDNYSFANIVAGVDFYKTFGSGSDIFYFSFILTAIDTENSLNNVYGITSVNTGSGFEVFTNSYLEQSSLLSYSDSFSVSTNNGVEFVISSTGSGQNIDAHFSNIVIV